jgi:phage gp36-like protein
MGRYIDWEDVLDRYPELNTIGGADQLSSAYIVYSEAYVDGILSPNFTPPFSNNNMIVRDLCIDWAYWRAARFKLDDAIEVKSSFFETVGLLKNGHLQMYDEAGTLIPALDKSFAWSNTQSYHTAFGMDDPVRWRIDEDQQDDDEGKRS